MVVFSFKQWLYLMSLAQLKTKSMTRLNIPQFLILSILLMAFSILGLAYFGGTTAKWAIVLLMLVGLLSDIFDGIIARKQALSTTTLRRMDSQVDIVFWLCIAIASYWLYPNIIKDNRFSFILLISTEALCHAVSFLRFRKETSTHAYLSKLWGLTLIVAFFILIESGQAGFWFKLSVVVGLISHADVILINLLLKKWTHDVPSAYHAWRIRKNLPIKRYRLFNG
jgi:phosphatidylglycerophosphate synthase